MMKKQIGGGITYKNPKGFTLIELLAVIVILAVIALILTPIVSGIIKTAKKNAFESTGYGILESTKLYYSKKVGNLESDLTFTCNNDTCTSEDEKLEFKGNINGSGTVLLFKDGNIALCLENNDYATLKNINDERLSTTEQGTCEFNEETKEYSVNASVSAKAYEELQNQYTVLNNTYTNGKEAIFNSLIDRGIEIDENATLEEMADNIASISSTGLDYSLISEKVVANNLDQIGSSSYTNAIVGHTYLILFVNISAWINNYTMVGTVASGADILYTSRVVNGNAYRDAGYAQYIICKATSTTINLTLTSMRPAYSITDLGL